MAAYISPGVYTYERDLSQYVSDLSTTIVAMVGTADVGPVNVPTLVTSAKQFTDLFGKQNPKHYLGYAALSYLSKGSMLYVNRVAPSDAKRAKVCFPLPSPDVTPISGKWILVASSLSSASFLVSDLDGLSSTEKTVILDSDTALPGFDFLDPNSMSNGKLGSDLVSFSTDELISKHIVGSRFFISTGAGKGSSANITSMDVSNPSAPVISVNAAKLNAFNSPVTATASGSISLEAGAVMPSDGDELLTLCSDKVGGSVKLVFSEVGTSYDSDVKKQALSDLMTQSAFSLGKAAALDSLVSVSSTDVLISIPLFDTSVSSNASKNALLVGSILSSLLSAFSTSINISAYTNLVAVKNISKAEFNSIVGLGYVALDSSSSSGIKGVSISGNSISLIGIIPGAAGSFLPVSPSAVIAANPVMISGTFTTNINRPSWVMSEAGDSLVPTLLKFTSIGDGDFSNIRIAVSFDPDAKKDGEQIYTTRVFSRSTAVSVDQSSELLSDFVLAEQFDGILDSMKDGINSSSNIVRCFVDYATDDSIDMSTGVVTLSPSNSDGLSFDPIISTDISGKGFIVGTSFSSKGSILDFEMLGGSAGSIVTAADIVGDSADKTGLHAFDDPEQVDINLLLAPGWSADPSVSKEMVAIAEDRSDCFAIIDTPFALTVQQAVDFRNKVMNINSSYGACYYPWVKVKDAVNNRDVFVPPSGLVVAQFAYSDQTAEVFSAPAGLSRGSIATALSTERILNRGDRDILYLNQINPIHFESGFGTYIRGQKTLQTSPTALDRVNVRRLFLHLRKIVATASRAFEFEIADSVTILRLKQVANTVLDEYLSKGAIRSFSIDVGDDVNTQYTLENNQIKMVISVEPSKVGEFIIEEFQILPQSGGILVSNS